MKINHLLIMILVLVCTARVYAGVAVTNHTESPQSKDHIELQWAVWWGSVPEFVCYWGAVPTRNDNINPYFCQEPETFTCGTGDDAVPCNDAVDGFSGQVTGSYTFNPEYWPDGVELGAHTFRVSVCTPEAVTVDTVISPDDSDINPKVALCGDSTYYTIDQDITITDTSSGGEEGDEVVAHEPSSIESQIEATQTSSSGVRNRVDDNEQDHIVADYGSYHIHYDSSDNDKKVVAYWGDWSVYGRQFDLDLTRVQNYTHIAYSFMGICNNASIEEIEATEDSSIRNFGGDFQNYPCKGLQKDGSAIGGGSADDAVAQPDGTLLIPDTWAALQKAINVDQETLAYPGDTQDDITMDNVRGVFKQLIDAKVSNPGLKVLASIGGWTQSTPFADVTGDETKKQVFIDSLKTFLTKWTLFDGIDIDWEYPRTDAEGELYVDLIKSVREALDELEIQNGKEYELSSAVFTPKVHVDRVDYSDAIQYMDYLFAMNYDYHGAWESEIGFHTNLFGVDEVENSVNQAMKNFIEAGVPKEKLLIGVGAYGRTKKLGEINDIDFTDNQLSGATTTTSDSFAGPGTWESGVLEWYDQYQYFWAHRIDDEGNVVGEDGTITIDDVDYNARVHNNYYYLTDPVRNADFLVNTIAKTFTDIESPRTAYNKARYAHLNDLAGVFFWVLEYDNGLITNSIHEGLESTVLSNPNDINMTSLIAAFGANTDADSLTQITGNELDEIEIDLPGVVISRPEGSDSGSYGHNTAMHGSSSSSVFYVVREDTIGPTQPIWGGDGSTLLTVPVVDQSGRADVAYVRAIRREKGTARQMNTGVYKTSNRHRESRLELKYYPNHNLHLEEGNRYTTLNDPLIIDAWPWSDWRMNGEALETFTFSFDFTIGTSSEIDLQAEDDVNEEALVEGINAEYFRGVSWRALGEFPDVIPYLERVEPAVNHANTNSNWAGITLRDNYAARYTGYIKVPADGRYVFTLRSDDGSRMTLSDEVIVDNDRTHAFRSVSSEILELEADAYYPLMIEYFERSGHQGLQLYYQGADSSNQRIVPSSMLSSEQSLECVEEDS